MKREAPGYDVATVRDRVLVADVLRSAGIDPPPHGRGRCPIHGGDGLSAFSITRDGRRWRCWSRCGPGDAIDLAMQLLGLTFAEALAHCAELAGIAPTTPAAVRASIEQREREQRARQEQDDSYRSRWAALIEEHDLVDGECFVLEVLERHDPESRDAVTRDLRTRLADAPRRRDAIEAELDELERSWREARGGR